MLRHRFFDIVGETGFEPATFWSQTRRANRAALHPELFWHGKDSVFFLFRQIFNNETFSPAMQTFEHLYLS